MPKGYGEFMLWADARRRAQNAAAIDPMHKMSALRSIKDSVTEQMEFGWVVSLAFWVWPGIFLLDLCRSSRGLVF